MARFGQRNGLSSTRATQLAHSRRNLSFMTTTTETPRRSWAGESGSAVQPVGHTKVVSLHPSQKRLQPSAGVTKWRTTLAWAQICRSGAIYTVRKAIGHKRLHRNEHYCKLEAILALLPEAAKSDNDGSFTLFCHIPDVNRADSVLAGRTDRMIYVTKIGRGRVSSSILFGDLSASG
ncbi:uncharacterized protein B0I36DRAFT_352403 [Microdochium trichocladiopsis]|uniref:Uncharacterized protein n=1 Tax=Microdochium trichocladiopsis TaxID=1682393 RepID=A0A9P8Y2X8_9PEZI|nr:uncharacterized protein B0I36DRAFT_352403 [Microdochium trichocladiopsis]KAH7026564.1 hypothetical protein B0I36DRAFT_352403 [Microdochium trichocladiopsis]